MLRNNLVCCDKSFFKIHNTGCKRNTETKASNITRETGKIIEHHFQFRRPLEFTRN